LSGGLLNNHIPSSAKPGFAVAISITKTSRREIIAECRVGMPLMKSLLRFQRTDTRWSVNLQGLKVQARFAEIAADLEK
jgi:hypothetical protein